MHRISVWRKLIYFCWKFSPALSDSSTRFSIPRWNISQHARSVTLAEQWGNCFAIKQANISPFPLPNFAQSSFYNMSNLPIFDSCAFLDSSWASNTTNVDETWQLPDLNNFDALHHQPIVTETQNLGPGPGGETLDSQWSSTAHPPAEGRTS